ncbi:MAG: hypothetical protein K2X55_21485 [Burkholderiaceae bacterium]|nr:hypothetical protein [Burkholderiaceae bacterium]
MTPLTIKDGTLTDFVAALATTGTSLAHAAERALELLRLAGYSGARGDTADDLHLALTAHLHLIHEFNLTVHIETPSETAAVRPKKRAPSAADNASKAIAAPDLIALAAAHRSLKVAMPLYQALDTPAIKVVLHAVATKARKRQPRIDFRKLAANDLD